MRQTLVVLGVACGACGKREETAVPAAPATASSTNSAIRYNDNDTGRFFVTNRCIDCDLCKETAPANFRRNEKDGFCYVYKQPASAEELKLCLEAAEGCPVEAIVDSLTGEPRNTLKTRNELLQKEIRARRERG